MESQKTNIKRVTLFEDGARQNRDIYIVGGTIKLIREDVRQGVFSGVYELDADGLFALPLFTDCGCFALGLKDLELPKLSLQEYKRFGFFSFITMLNPLDNPARLLEQKECVGVYGKAGMFPRYITGGTRNKMYHLGENIYEDIIKSEYCAGASALVEDRELGIDHARFANMARQVAAAAADTDRPCVTIALLGDAAVDFAFIDEALGLGTEYGTVIPAFVNRNKGTLNAGLLHLNEGGLIMLVACGDTARMNAGCIPLSQSLARIMQARGNLDGVLAASYSGGFLPKKDTNSLDVRGEIVNLSSELREAISLGVPITEVLKTVTKNPAAVFGLDHLKISEDRYARFLLADEDLNIKYIVDGNQIYPPDSYRTPVLFF